jgi:hypothetical protein
MASKKRYQLLLLVLGLCVALLVLGGARGDASACTDTVCIAGVQLEVDTPQTVPVSTEFSVLTVDD